MATSKKKEKEEVKVVANWDKDTKRKKRFVIEDNESGVVGNLYVDKDKEIPSSISVVLSEGNGD